MRLAGLIVAGLLLPVALLSAQQGSPPAQEAVFDPTKHPEDWMLAKWEEAMNGVQSLVADCEFTSVDKVFNAKDEYKGKAKYLHNKAAKATMASLELYKVGPKGVLDKDSFKKFIFTGTYLYHFVPENKVVQVIQLQQQGNQMGDNNLLSFIFGMKAADAKQRYQMKFFVPHNPADPNHYYLDVFPKSEKDKQDFKRARLVFLKKTFMIRQVWFEEANGNEVVWYFPDAVLNDPSLKAVEFATPQIPSGWRMEKAPVVGQPKVIHGQK